MRSARVSFSCLQTGIGEHRNDFGLMKSSVKCLASCYDPSFRLPVTVFGNYLCILLEVPYDSSSPCFFELEPPLVIPIHICIYTLPVLANPSFPNSVGVRLVVFLQKVSPLHGVCRLAQQPLSKVIQAMFHMFRHPLMRRGSTARYVESEHNAFRGSGREQKTRFSGPNRTRPKFMALRMEYHSLNATWSVLLYSKRTDSRNVKATGSVSREGPARRVIERKVAANIAVAIFYW